MSTSRKALGLLTAGTMMVIWSTHFATVGATSRSRSSGGEGGSCPTEQEMHPCMCRVVRNALDITCTNALESQVRVALSYLKQREHTIYWLRLRSCSLPRIHDYLFMNLNVHHLTVIRSNVTWMERSAFTPLRLRLESLDLSGNRIRDVPTAAFRRLRKLSYLNLNGNEIATLYGSAFQHLPALQRLSLYDNEILHIRDTAFAGLNELKRLNLGKNQLPGIPSGALGTLRQLEVLDLHENRIPRVPTGAFVGLYSLDMLKLEYNRITSLQDGVFSDLVKLTSLNLENNNISKIAEYAFSGLEGHLEFVELGSNQLSAIPSHALRQLRNLHSIDLDSNRITSIPEDAFWGYGNVIKFILLDKNNIRHIHPAAFQPLPELEWLKLSDNALTALPEATARPVLDTATMIDLSNNPLVCSCDILWLRDWLLDTARGRDSVESANDATCTASGNTVYYVRNLPDNAVSCHSHVADLEPCVSCPPSQNESHFEHTTFTSLTDSTVHSSSVGRHTDALHGLLVFSFLLLALRGTVL